MFCEFVHVMTVFVHEARLDSAHSVYQYLSVGWSWGVCATTKVFKCLAFVSLTDSLLKCKSEPLVSLNVTWHS